MLPDDFRWSRRYQNAPPGELALMCGTMVVAQLMQRVDRSWYALLSPSAEPLGPIKSRSCTSRESGIAGIEAWATRNADRLREQARIKSARECLTQHLGTTSSPAPPESS